MCIRDRFPFNIYTMVEASDFKFRTQLEFAKAHHKITPIGKSGHGLALGKLPKVWTFHFNIYTMTEARDIKFDTQLRFAKAHHKTTPRGKWAWLGAPIYLGFPFIIFAAAALFS